VNPVWNLIKFAAALIGAYAAVVAAWNAGAEVFG